jgi:DNA-binding transcriptional LysR family regulator
MLDLNDIYYFVQVVDRKSITAAARALSMPKSTIGHRIQQLEAALDARLINRTSRQFAVTDIGAEFYVHAALMLRNAEAAENAVKRRMIEPGGLIRISVALATAQFAMGDLLAEFGRRFPKVRILQQASDDEVDIVAEGFDLAVRAHTAPLPDSQLIQRPLAPVPWMLFCGSGYAEHAGLPSTPEELSERPALFMVRGGLPCQWTLRHASQQSCTVRLEPRLMTDCMATLKQSAKMGLGIVALPGYVCRDEVRTGGLVRVLPEWTAEEATMTALVPHRQGLLPSVRALLDFLAVEMPKVVTV